MPNTPSFRASLVDLIEDYIEYHHTPIADVAAELERCLARAREIGGNTKKGH